VQLLPCQPLALIPVNGQSPEIGGQTSDQKMAAARDLGSPGGDFNKRKLSFSWLFRPLSKCST